MLAQQLVQPRLVDPAHDRTGLLVVTHALRERERGRDHVHQTQREERANPAADREVRDAEREAGERDTEGDGCLDIEGCRCLRGSLCCHAVHCHGCGRHRREYRYSMCEMTKRSRIDTESTCREG